MEPLVTCVMVTGGPERQWWAQRSFLAYCKQKRYPNRELLVINESQGTEWEFHVVPDGVDVNAREIMLPYHVHTLGSLRNIGKTEAEGDWILQWDDDDWFHHERIYDQMRFRQDGYCQTLFAQVRYCMRTGTAYTYSNPGTGIAGTILHPRTDFMYPNQTGWEDTPFLLGGWGEDRISVLNNVVRPHLYIRFFHGNNLSDARHVMRKYAETKWHGRWVDLPEQWGWVSRPAAHYLHQILPKHYGVKLPPRPWVDVLARRRRKHHTDDDVIVEGTEAT